MVTMMLQLEEITRLVGEGMAAAQVNRNQEVRVTTSQLKMNSPNNFDGKTTANFNQ